MQNRSGIKIVVLAAGKGKRMASDLPKVLMQVGGTPMIAHLMGAISKSGIDDSPVVIVGYREELVREALGEKYNYVNQGMDPLGTGHAVLAAKNILENRAKHIFVLYGDQPFVSPETIKKIADQHLASGKKITMATVKLPDFEGWRKDFYNFSRVIRDADGKIIRTVEQKDASEEEKKITEVNPCYFCFEASWLWPKLESLKNDNAQSEYYLTDVIKIAHMEGLEIESLEIDPREALGANTREELGILEEFANNK